MARDERPWASATKPMPQASSSRVVGGSTSQSSCLCEGRRRVPATWGDGDGAVDELTAHVPIPGRA